MKKHEDTSFGDLSDDFQNLCRCYRRKDEVLGSFTRVEFGNVGDKEETFREGVQGWSE